MLCCYVCKFVLYLNLIDYINFFWQKQPEIHLFAARFKELSGDIVGARTQYQILYSEVSPGLLEAFVRHANMEYRLVFIDPDWSFYFLYLVPILTEFLMVYRVKKKLPFLFIRQLSALKRERSNPNCCHCCLFNTHVFYIW